MPDCKWNKKQETVREREGEVADPWLKEISPLSLKGSWSRFIIVAIVCLCSAHAAASSELSQIQYSNSVSLAQPQKAATLRYPVLLSLTSGATCTSVALRCSHPLHPLPTHAHTDAHTQTYRN